MKTYKITIQDVPANLNKLMRMHWGAQDRIKGRFNRAVWAGMHQAKFPKSYQKPPKKVHIDIAIYVGNSRGRTGDPDGFLKHLLDSLKDNGIIHDDDQKWCEWERPVVKRDVKNPRTEIEIREV